jgi:hypothetical protein
LLFGENIAHQFVVLVRRYYRHNNQSRRIFSEILRLSPTSPIGLRSYEQDARVLSWGAVRSVFGQNYFGLKAPGGVQLPLPASMAEAFRSLVIAAGDKIDVVRGLPVVAAA